MKHNPTVLLAFSCSQLVNKVMGMAASVSSFQLKQKGENFQLGMGASAKRFYSDKPKWTIFFRRVIKFLGILQVSC